MFQMFGSHRRLILGAGIISVFISIFFYTAVTSDQKVEQMPRSQRTGQLRRYYSETANTTHHDLSLTVIVIPELGHFKDKSWDWLEEDLKRVAPLAEVLIFDYDLDYSETGVWRVLLQKGQDLLHSLVEEGKQYGLGDRPILFICHGLGGLILKRALVTMNQQFHDPGFQRFLNVSSGLVFFGTPHPNFNHREQWFRLGLMLRSHPRISKLMRSQAELEANILAYVTQEFDQIDIDTPVISVFETKATKINEGFLKRPRREILVDKSFAETQAKKEKLVEAPADHHEVHQVRSGTAVFNEIAELVLKALREMQPLEESQVPVAGQIVMGPEEWETTASEIDREDAGNLFAPSSSALHTTQDASDRLNLELAGITIADILKQTPAPTLPCYLLDAAVRLSEFYGREDVLLQLDRALLPTPKDDMMAESTSSSVPERKVFALWGLGGVGKTQIATEFAYTRKEHYDAVLWIQADSLTKLAESFRQIAVGMQLIDASEASNYVVSRNVVMRWLENPSKSNPTEGGEHSGDESISWLMIFDNADKLELLQDYWPGEGSQGSILITSRDPVSRTYHFPSAGLYLEPLNDEDGAILLRRLSGATDHLSPRQRDESIKLSNRLGGLPLAISTFATIIQRRELRYEEMLRLYEEDYSVAYVKPMRLSSHQDPYERSMLTAWALDDFTGSATDLLDVICLLDPDAIQEQILSFKVSAGSRLQNWPTSFDEYTKARSDLSKSSLIRRNQELEQITVHRMVQDFARHRMSPERLKEVFAFVVELLISRSPSDPEKFSHKTSDWEMDQQMLPHILRLDELSRRHPELVDNKSTKIALADLLKQGGWYLKERGSFDLCKAPLIHALNLAEQIPEDTQELRADLLFSFASLAGESNDAKDHLYYAQRHLAARLETVRRDKDLGMAYAELSVSLSNNGRYLDGLEAGQESLRIYQQTEEYLRGVYWPHFAIIHQALALLALKRGVEAINMLIETISWRVRMYGVNDTESFKLGYVLQVLGNIYVQEGRWEEAFDAYQAGLANYRATVGMNYHRSGHLCVKLAECHGRQKQYETAEILLDQAISSFSSQGFYKKEIMRATFIKAQYLREQQDETSYQELMKQVEKMYNELVPPTTQYRSRDFITREILDDMVFIWAR